MNKEQIKTKITETGHEIDDFVEDTAANHNYPKWKVWLGIAAVLVLVGLAAAVIK